MAAGERQIRRSSLRACKDRSRRQKEEEKQKEQK
jgi:hypothetical protein